MPVHRRGRSAVPEFRLLGRPVSHSVSPALHEAAFRHWGIDASYGALDVAPEDLESTVARVAAAGGGNVTLPYKSRVAALIERPGDTVRGTDACNCFWGSPDGLRGENTDVGGFIAACGDLGVSLAGARVLVLGAGGAARAVLHALEREGAGRVEIWNRTRSRAEALAAGARLDTRVRADPPRGIGVDLVVNATRLGLDPADPLPLELADVDAGAALDLVYGPDRTAWVRHASARGIPCADGVDMLVHQAALSLGWWFPEREPPVDAMRRAAAVALGRAPE